MRNALIRNTLVFAPLLGLAACMAAPPPLAAPPEVIAQSVDVSLATLPAATVARWTGSYRSGGQTLGISRVGDQLWATRAGAPLALKLVGLGTFVDPAGTSYLFLPADGGSGRLETIGADGSRINWSR